MLWINNINWWQKWMVGRLKRQEINAFKLIGFYSLRFLCRIQSVFTVHCSPVWWKAIFELESDGDRSRIFFFKNEKKARSSLFRTKPNFEVTDQDFAISWRNRTFPGSGNLNRTPTIWSSNFKPNSDNLNLTSAGYSVQLKAC